MRWLVLALLLLPSATAIEGWYYSGDTFEDGDTLYSVEGASYENVLLGVGGRLYLISLYDCRTEGLSEFCYTQTAYPSDEDHIKYSAGNKYYGYYLTVTTFTPEIDVERTIDEDSLEIGGTATVTVTVRNEGDYPVRDLLYEEKIPEGLTVVTGPVAGRTIKWARTSLPTGQQERFTYSVRGDRFGEYALAPTFKYTHEGTTYNESVDGETIEVESPLEVSINASKTLSLDQTGIYTLNLTNVDDALTLGLRVLLSPPAGILVKDTKGFTKAANGSYTSELSLEPDDMQKLSLEIIATQGGTLTVPLAIEMTTEDGTTTLAYETKITSNDDKVLPSITLSNKNALLYAGTELTVNGVLENENDAVKFKNVKGSLSLPVGEPAAFNQDSLSPGKTVTEVTRRITLPSVIERTTFPITFSGSYESPGGRIFEFSVTKEIAVVPRTTYVTLARTVEPTTPTPGSNVTVTVTLTNMYGQYLTLDAHEKYVAALTKVSGLSFAETSIEKDAAAQIYVYELEIPADFEGDRFNITTVVKVKDAPQADEFTTEILLKGATATPIAVDVAPLDDAFAEEAPVAEAPKEGFFKKLWGLITSFFS